MEWELTDEDKLKIFRAWRLEQGMNVLIDNYLQMQARKLAEWLLGLCEEHWHGRKQRIVCAQCRMELRRLVELE